MSEEYLTPSEVMEHLGIDYEELRKLCREQRLKPIRSAGEAIRFRKVEVAEFRSDGFSDYMLAPKAAEFIGVCYMTFVSWVKDGWIPFHIEGKHRVYKKSELEPFRKKAATE